MSWIPRTAPFSRQSVLSGLSQKCARPGQAPIRKSLFPRWKFIGRTAILALWPLIFPVSSFTKSPIRYELYYPSFLLFYHHPIFLYFLLYFPHSFLSFLFSHRTKSFIFICSVKLFLIGNFYYQHKFRIARKSIAFVRFNGGNEIHVAASFELRTCNQRWRSLRTSSDWIKSFVRSKSFSIGQNIYANSWRFPWR